MARTGKYREWLEEDKLILLKGWARSGLNDEQIAKNMDISLSTFYEWKNKYSEISDALKSNKEIADFIVENALYKNATGHKVTLKKPIKVRSEKQLKDKGKIVEEHIEYVEEEIYIPPNVTAQIFWLKNRKPDEWREKRIPKPEEVEFEDDKLLEMLSEALSDEEMQDDIAMIEELEADEE